jgi:2-polyprenyl-3-methyl-5-hydroxy-6-metoxy-1,4-benzoquinol methylase
VYVYKSFGYKIHCLDYSEIECLKTEANFRLLNIPCKIFKADLFSEETNFPLFDIVYSLGFIEHFLDTDLVIEKHLKFLKKGGLLLICLPNFTGINYFFLKVLTPELLLKHNLKVMDIESWKSFEQKLNLQTMFKGYVGGFEPSVFNRREKKTLNTFILKAIAKLFSILLSNHFKFLRKYNSKYFSGYVMGVYKKSLENS